MYNTKKLVLAAVVTLLLVACSESNKTTDWYIQNTLEQAIDLEECKRYELAILNPPSNKTPELHGAPDCFNAERAELIIQQGTDAIKKYRASRGL